MKPVNRAIVLTLKKQCQLSINDLKGKNVTEKISSLESISILPNAFPSLDNYIDSKKEDLFKLFKIIFPDCKEKLKSRSGQYRFSMEDRLFIEVLLDKSENSEVIQLLRNRRFNDLDSNFLDCLLWSIRELIKNPNNSLNRDDVCYYFKPRLSKEYNDLIEQLDSIFGILQYFYSAFDRNPNFDRIKEILKHCHEEIFSLCKKNSEYPYEDFSSDIIKTLNLEKCKPRKKYVSFTQK